jgi:RNA polymerase sigma-70 factor (ECF subfamily)
MEGRFMGTTEIAQSRDDVDALVAAATAGDESAFSALVDRHRRELQVHCYRMLGSLEDSEDVTQETFLRAWRKRASFAGRASFRAWLYRIATNACLDALERRLRRVPPDGGEPAFEVPWLQPYPDRLLEGIATDDAEPDAAVVEKETIELAFMVAIQHLAPRQRAVLILRDVLGWSAKDTAALLEGSVASVNSALQRARAALKLHLPERRLEWASGSDASDAERALVRRYVEATERADADALAEIMREDARFSMPPEPGLYVGRELIVASWKEGGFGTEAYRDFRCVVTRANMQPAVANYLRRPGDSAYRALAMDVLRIEDGAVAEITAFGADVFPAFGLPETL